MAITNVQQTQIIKIVIGLFNGGIGTSNLTALATLVDDGMSMSDLSDLLARIPLFTDNIMGGKITVQSQVNVMMNHFGVVADSDPTSPGSQAEQFFIDKISAGVGFGAIVDEAVNYLSQDNVPAEFAEVAALLDNKALVSEVYVETNSPAPDDFALLADVTATSPATREEAIVFIDNFISGPIIGQTLILTTEIDNLVGNSGNDIFIGDKNTTSIADTLVGGDGKDILQLSSTNIAPNYSGIEQVLYTTPGGDISVADFADVTSVELKNSTPVIVTTLQGQAVTLTSSDATLAGDFVTSLNLTLDKVGTASNQGAISLAGAGLTTLNITGANNASSLDINPGPNPSPLKTLNIAGDQNITATVRLGVTTIDASSTSGNIFLMPGISTDLTFKGGSGDDKIVMSQSLTSGDTLMGGAGIDTLSVFAGPISSASAVANISEFEILEAAEEGTYDLSFLNVKNALTGLVISSIGNTATTISNINAASTGNIKIVADTENIVLSSSDFVAGGTNDTATIILEDSSINKSFNGIDTRATFDNLDVLNLISKSDGTPTKILNVELNDNEIEERNTLVLTAPDIDKVVITGDEALLLLTNYLPSEIDASGLDAPIFINTNITQISSILAKGTTYDDHFQFINSNITQATLFTGGGSDSVIVNGSSSSAHIMFFTATELNAGDLKAGDTTEVELRDVTAGATVTINLTSQLEGLLKSGGALLSDTNANINILGTSLSDTTNIAASLSGQFDRFFHDTVRLQFDLNGDGVYSATDDAQISLIGTGSTKDANNNTLVYNAAADTLIYTVV